MLTACCKKDKLLSSLLYQRKKGFVPHEDNQPQKATKTQKDIKEKIFKKHSTL